MSGQTPKPSDAPAAIVQPGAPGQPSKTLSAAAANPRRLPSGAAQEPALYDFATDDNTQRAEIEIMRRMLNENRTRIRAPDSTDPRIRLKAGLHDAGEAASGMRRLATLPKPPGFAPGDAVMPPPEPPAETPGEGGAARRPPGIQYGPANSDLAFSGNYLFAGNYNGVNFHDIDSPGRDSQIG